MSEWKQAEAAVRFVHDQAEARATGSWRFDPEKRELLLEYFHPCSSMNPEVAKGFPVATAVVPVTDTGLGIVLAARSCEVTEYRAEDLPPDVGSGFWLRGFQADRSVAVPQLNSSGELLRILSVAVVGLEIPTSHYASLIRTAYEKFPVIDPN